MAAAGSCHRCGSATLYFSICPSCAARDEFGRVGHARAKTTRKRLVDTALLRKALETLGPAVLLVILAGLFPRVVVPLAAGAILLYFTLRFCGLVARR